MKISALIIISLILVFVGAYGLYASEGHEDHEHSDILFHPYLVHFPIAFFFLEGFLLILWKISKDDKYEQFAYLILSLGVLAALAAMVTGYIDAGGINKMVRPHAFSAVVLFSVNFIRWNLRRYYKFYIWQGKWRYVYIVLLILSLALTSMTGHLGGQLVYA